MKKNWTGERLETFIKDNNAIEHLHRYAITKDYVKNKIVLDIASGEGYGSNLLAKEAKTVIGVDIDEISIELAKKKYNRENLKFLTGSADNIPLKDNSVDVVVSFETIEHHDKHDEMLREIKRVLTPSGVLIISSPDKKYYSDIPKKENPFHIKELYLNEFKEVIEKYFSTPSFFLQKMINNNSIIAKENLFEEILLFQGDYENIIQNKTTPLYNIAIASDEDHAAINFSIFDGRLFSDHLLKESINKVRESTSYRIGSMFVYPLHKIRRLLGV